MSAPPAVAQAVSLHRMECLYCGALQNVPALAGAKTAHCWRCHSSFGRGRTRHDAALAFLLTAFVLFAVTNLATLLGIEVGGRAQSIRLGSGVIGLADHGLAPLALFVLVISIAAPLFRLLALGVVLIGLARHAPRKWLAATLRFAETLRAWAMLDVFLVGTLVALTKLQDLASVQIGLGLWCLGLLVLSLAAAEALIDSRALWNRIAAPDPAEKPLQPSYIACRTCALVQAPSAACIRCGGNLHRREPQSQSRAAALVITGFVLYIPANLYPVITVISFGRANSATIVGGVKELMNGSDWPLAIIVFTASVAVPLLKLVGLSWLLISTRLGLQRRLADRTRLYRLIKLVSRWSAVDIFVAALLTALVTLGNLATIEPGLGVLAFGSVVLVTMLATECFDTRLMWDAAGANDV